MNQADTRLSAQSLRFIAVALWIVVLVLGVRFARIVAKASVNPSGDFAIYYTSSRLLREGADPARDYDNAWFNARVMERTPMKGAVDVNPPTSDLALLPIAGLDYGRALRAWTIVNVLALAAAVCFLISRLGLGRNLALAFVCIVLLDHPVLANFNKGQFYVLVLALMTVAWYAYRNRRDTLLGGAIAAILLVKLAGWMLLLLLIAQRRWRALAWSVGFAVAVVVLALPWLKPSAWVADIHALRAFDATGLMALTDYQAQYGFFHRLFVRQPGINPHPILNAPWLAAAANWTGVITVIGFSLRAAFKAQGEAPQSGSAPSAGAWQDSDTIFAAFVAAGLVLSPASLEYHYTLMLLPIALLLASRERGAWWFWLCVAVVLTVIPLPYAKPALTHGAWMLLAYPRLYGAYLLWGMALWASLRALTAQVSMPTPQRSLTGRPST